MKVIINNKKIEVDDNAILEDVIKKYFKEKNIVAAYVNDIPRDLSDLVTNNSIIEPITTDDKDGLDILRHTCAHIFGHAIKQIYPEVKMVIGPVIENGFYYDFARTDPFTKDDLKKIEKKMSEIIDRNVKTKREVWKRNEAINHFKKIGEKYKAEIIESIPENEELSVYHHGDTWHDLCRGPHAPSTGKIKHFKLMKVAGAYWRGDEKNKQLTRIYGITFPKNSELKEHLELIEEAKKRDHRKLGKSLDFFHFH